MDEVSEVLVTGNDDECLESCSLSIESFSKDSLFNEKSMDNYQNILSCSFGMRNVALEMPPKMCVSAIQHRNDVETSVFSRKSVPRKSSDTNQHQKCTTNTSTRERPWSTPARNVFMVSFSAKQCEEKLQLAKEEENRRQRQKIDLLSKSERNSQNARLRKERELQRRIKESNQRSSEKQRINVERKERLNLAEEERRRIIEMKICNISDTNRNPRLWNTQIVHSTHDANKATLKNSECTQNIFVNKKPLSSTGKVVGFGSSTPRTICDSTIKLNHRHTKIPEALLLKCQLLSRPSSSRMCDRMIDSVHSPRVSDQTPDKLCYDEKRGIKTTTSFSLTTSAKDFPPKGRSVIHTPRQQLPKKDLTIKHGTVTIKLAPKEADSLVPKRQTISGRIPAAPLSNTTKCIQEISPGAATGSLRSHKCVKEITSRARPIMLEENIDYPTTRSRVSLGDESRSKLMPGRRDTTMDVTEAEYRTRLIENRRMMREKRESDREQLAKLERERKNFEDTGSTESTESENEPCALTAETFLTISNDDTLEGLTKVPEEDCDPNTTGEELSELLEINELSEVDSKFQTEKFERKKKLDSIMSRIRVSNEQSSSEEGVRSESDRNVSSPAFRSYFLHSMMENRRMSNSANQSNGFTVRVFQENGECTTQAAISDQEKSTLSSCRQTCNHDESDHANAVREVCDGKDDSLSLKKNSVKEKCNAAVDERSFNKVSSYASLSSTETDYEIIKTSLDLNSVGKPPYIIFMTQENSCVLQN